ncbi:LysR family transcriptional regulator [Aneurinibacillus migulanus]|uniref:LysR family transcriptional regulator n=1 Tax=Aneurinibacillus migulanus TaxID=47500 RepID=UPI00399D26D7
MNYEHWETFITLAETNSFTRTAEKLNISQTTVTLKLNYSNYTLRLYTGHSKRMFQLLLDGIIDVCVVPSKPQHPDLEYVRLF